MFIAQTSFDGKQAEALAKAASKIRLVTEKEDGTSEDDVSMEVFIEEGSQTAAEQNLPGSYEALMQGFRDG